MPRKKRLVDRDLRRSILKTLNFHKFIVWAIYTLSLHIKYEIYVRAKIDTIYRLFKPDFKKWVKQKHNPN